MPKISVIIPCYNQGQYLNDSVDSVLKQSFQDFEIVIVDDNSTDDSPSIVKSQERKDARIRTIFHDINKKVSAARNTAIRFSEGTFIAPLDADDILHIDFLKCTLSILESGVSDIAYTDVILMGQNSSYKKMPEYNFKNFLERNQFCSCILFWKKHWEEVGGYNETFLDGYEDWEFGINMGCHGHYGKRIPKALFYYRQHSGSRNEIARRNEWLIRNRLESMYHQIVGRV